MDTQQPVTQWARSQASSNDSSPEMNQAVIVNDSGTDASRDTPAEDRNHEAATEVATLSPPIGQFVMSTILNIAGIVAAVAFGVFAVRSVALTAEANTQSKISNQMALTSFCLTRSNVSSQHDLSSCFDKFSLMEFNTT